MKEKTVYICTECGQQSAKWVGRCPGCGEWNTMEAAVATPAAGSGSKRRVIPVKPARLKEVVTREEDRLHTGIPELDRVLGGGLRRDSMTILASPPGGGKSTLSLMAARELAAQGLRILYASGEESEGQIKSRADRILGEIPDGIWLLSDTSLDKVLGAVEEVDPDLLIIDSIQTFALEAYAPARAGNPTQTMGCAGELARLAKSAERPRAVILIGQMNKNDELAGLRALEHLVDTVLILEGDSGEELRSMIATKNRFGSTGEMGFFSMTEKGMLSIDNPSAYFVTEREAGQAVTGSALTVIREGSRPIIAEIESLVSRSFTPYPARIGEALRREQLNTLISILEQRCGVGLYDKNVVVKTTGGIRLREPAANLAVLVSIASSALNRPAPPGSAFIGDVGLTGELKKVPGLEARVRELDRMGFDRVFVPAGALREFSPGKLRVCECKTLIELLEKLFQFHRNTG